MKILVMGLPGSGKTYLTKRLQPLLNAAWYNADKVREMSNDWDFSSEGRLRQAKRMANLAKKLKDQGSFVVADFVCPTPEARKLFNPDFVIWMDTIKKGRFEDTNKMFIPPKKYDVKVTEKNSDFWSIKIKDILMGM